MRRLALALALVGCSVGESDAVTESALMEASTTIEQLETEAVAQPEDVEPEDVEPEDVQLEELELEEVDESKLSPEEVQQAVRSLLAARGREHEYECLATIFFAESSWRPDAIGDVDIGGSYGLPQRHAPAHGKPKLPWPIEEQVEWALEYADERYGGVCKAAEARAEQGWW